jgi:large subunit ribosomal protein L25
LVPLVAKGTVFLLIFWSKTMQNQFQLAAKQRTDVGKGASRRLRRQEDYVPGIIYGGEKDPMSIMIEHRHIIKAIQNEAFFSHIIQLKIDEQDETVLIKALQRHVYKRRVLHVDFQRVTGKEILHRHVPLHFLNAEICPGVKQGGVVTHNMKDVEITCSAANLPEFIVVDLANLELHHAIHLSELVLPANVKLTTAVAKDDEHDQAVVTVALPRVVVEEEPVTAADEVTEGEKGKADEDKKDDNAA